MADLKARIAKRCAMEFNDGDFINFVRALCGNDTVDYNMEVALSERQNGYMKYVF